MLETERLLIRPFMPCDLDAIFSVVYSDQEVLKPFSNFKGTRDAFALRFETDPLFTGVTPFHYFAVIRKKDSAILGLMGFQNHADEDTSWLRMPDGSCTVGKDPTRLDVELTYAFGKAYWGMGYAREAGEALISYGFREIGIHRIINAISPENTRSANLMRRLGFTLLDNGNPEDVIGLLERLN